MGRQNDMGKDKDYITVNITIEQAVKAIVRSFGETQDTVIISMANHIHGAGFRMSYKEWEITIPDQESVHIECYIPYNNVIGYLFVVAEKGWDGTYIDQTKNPIDLITKTKDGDEVIYQGTKYESKIARINEVREKYTGAPILFRKFKANITAFEELRKRNNMPIPEYWVDDNSEGMKDPIDDTDWGTDWGDISITIETSGNLLFERISTNHGQREHADTLGLVNVKNNDPSAEGKVMMRLAKGLPVKANQANKKYISKIRASLWSFFKIDKKNDPFYRYDSTYGYRPKFTLKETITSQDDRASRRATHITDDDGAQTEQGFEKLTDVERAVEDMSQAEKDAEIEQLEQSQADPFGGKKGR